MIHSNRFFRKSLASGIRWTHMGVAEEVSQTCIYLDHTQTSVKLHLLLFMRITDILGKLNHLPPSAYQLKLKKKKLHLNHKITQYHKSQKFIQHWQQWQNFMESFSKAHLTCKSLSVYLAYPAVNQTLFLWADIDR